MEKKPEKVDMLFFEVSWEVCNKVGGIYTVVSSKAGRMIEEYGENYYAIGPYFMKKAQREFREEIIPDFLRDISETLKKEGIVIRYGKWLIEGQPNALLIDFAGFAARKNEIKKELWESFKVDSMNSDYFDFDEPVIWAYAAGRFADELSRKVNRKICLQAHEWLSGAAILYIKKSGAKVATVFTTHATVLGRSISSSNTNLYASLESIKPEQECYTMGVHSKHQIERASALQADIFTTVSDITGLEATYLLGRKPDLLLPNGLDLKKFPTFEQASIAHDHVKRKIKEFISYYFFPYYTFQLEHTLIYFLSGRYEFHNKGIDTCIAALGKVNEQLKKEKSSRTVVVFFWVPANVRGIKPEILENRTFYEDIKGKISDSLEDVKTHLIYSMVNETIATCGDLFGEENLREIIKRASKFRKKGLPPLSTHELYNEANDDILKAFQTVGLLNREEDRVKVIFYPTYITGADGLLDIDYYDSIQGSHLGIFPSYYEPWGYTPLECGALGVPSITTDLAGFGRYIQKKDVDGKGGIFVVKRYNKTDAEVTEQLFTTIYKYTILSREDRVRNKLHALHLAGLADWKFMAKNYIKAHSLAAEKRFEK